MSERMDRMRRRNDRMFTVIFACVVVVAMLVAVAAASALYVALAHPEAIGGWVARLVAPVLEVAR